MTNADWIRNMNNEELTKFLIEVALKYVSGHAVCRSSDCISKHGSCRNCVKEWLEKERD